MCSQHLIECAGHRWCGICMQMKGIPVLLHALYVYRGILVHSCTTRKEAVICMCMPHDGRIGTRSVASCSSVGNKLVTTKLKC